MSGSTIGVRGARRARVAAVLGVALLLLVASLVALADDSVSAYSIARWSASDLDTDEPQVAIFLRNVGTRESCDVRVLLWETQDGFGLVGAEPI